MPHRIAVLPGDGIGPDVVAAAQRLAEAAGAPVEWVELPVGLAAHAQYGTTLPEATLRGLAECAGAVLGPLSTHAYHGPTMPNVSGHLRTRLQLYANIRPVRAWPGVSCRYPELDVVVVRENTQGFYADRNVLDGNGELRPDPDTVLSVRVVTRAACGRLVRAACRLAAARRGHLTLVHKANVLRLGDGLFLEEGRRVAAGFAGLRVDDLHVDACALHLLLRPADFDVIATTNMFGDILSDQTAGMTGGLGLAPGLNVGDGFAVAQAVHGSAPDLAAARAGDPVAEMLSLALLLRHLGEGGVADRMEAAVGRALGDPAGPRTPDLGGRADTARFAEAICRAVA
jgi:3-isopropylmalate dehydrogenase